MRGRERRALEAYLLLLTLWPWLADREQPLSGEQWARALNGNPNADSTLRAHNRGTVSGARNEVVASRSPGSISAAWGDLERLRLVERRRLPHGVVVIPRREDARGPYQVPVPGPGPSARAEEGCLWLPGAFWAEDLHRRLTTPGIAMLLAIAASTTQAPSVALGNAQAATHFGLATRTVQKGLADLGSHGLVIESRGRVASLLSATGSTPLNSYRLIEWLRPPVA